MSSVALKHNTESLMPSVLGHSFIKMSCVYENSFKMTTFLLHILEYASVHNTISH